MSYIWRTTKSPDVVAKGFANFCKTHGIITRGYIRVGRTPRGLRGLIAAKDIKADDSVVIVPDNAIMTPFDPLRSESFLRATQGLDLAKDVFPFSKVSSRVGNSFLYDHHVMMALFIAHILLAPAETEKFRDVVDYMPRGEANFSELQRMLERTVDHCQVFSKTAPVLAQSHHISMEDMRSVVIWALTMVISRTIPVEHTETLKKFSEGTALHADVSKETGQTASFHVAALAPLIDMINHDENENVAIAVPDVKDTKARYLIARSTRAISKGEEICYKYGGVHDTQMMSVFYGMEYVPAVAPPALSS